MQMRSVMCCAWLAAALGCGTPARSTTQVQPQTPASPPTVDVKAVKGCTAALTTAKADVDALPPRASTFGEDWGSPLPCTTTMPHDQICQCLKRDSVYPGECTWVDDGSTEGVRIARAGNGQGHHLYVVTESPRGWAVADMVFYEQGHGKHSARLDLLALDTCKLGHATLAWIEYTDTSETIMVGYGPNGEHGVETQTARGVTVCVVDGKGAPSCPVAANLACEYSLAHIDDESADQSAVTDGWSVADVSLHSDGTAVVKRLGHERSDETPCAVTPAAYRLW